MEAIEIQKVAGPFRGVVKVPGSKSITNRALPLAALCEGETELTGLLFADDTWQMINALQELGYSLWMDQAAKTVRIVGMGKNVPDGKGKVIGCGNSGTTIRFLTAMLTAGEGEYILDGIARMRERPIDQLVDQLRVLGAEIGYVGKEGYPPVRIKAKGLPGGGCSFSDAKSSQYISAVLMAGGCAQEQVTVSLVGAVTSEPYVMMTLRMMEQFGVRVSLHDQCAQEVSRSIVIPNSGYNIPAGGTYAIEPDASNASYFLAAAALIPGSSVTVEGLGKGSLQGDVGFADVLHAMGAGLVYGKDFVTVTAPPDGKLRGIELDMNHIPDMVQTVAVAALFAEGKTVVRNVWNLRVKETDRLAALETELRKLGATVETGRDWISITPPPGGKITPAKIATYEDHRMAMAFAIAGLRDGGVTILDPGCTAKTYPEYFVDLNRAVSAR